MNADLILWRHAEAEDLADNATRLAATTCRAASPKGEAGRPHGDLAAAQAAEDTRVWVEPGAHRADGARATASTAERWLRPDAGPRAVARSGALAAVAPSGADRRPSAHARRVVANLLGLSELECRSGRAPVWWLRQRERHGRAADRDRHGCRRPSSSEARRAGFRRPSRRRQAAPGLARLSRRFGLFDWRHFCHGLRDGKLGCRRSDWFGVIGLLLGRPVLSVGTAASAVLNLASPIAASAISPARSSSLFLIATPWASARLSASMAAYSSFGMVSCRARAWISCPSRALRPGFLELGHADESI